MLNTSKNKIYISTNGIDPRPFLNVKVMKQLNKVIKRYTDGEVNLGGLKVLGIPVGSPSFIRSRLRKFKKTLADDTFELLQTYPDLNTVAQVYTRCLLIRVPYRIFAYTMECLGLDEAFLMGDALDWSSPFSDTVDALSRQVYASLSSQM